MPWRYYQYDSRQENQTVGVNYVTGITEQIKEKAEVIARILSSGNSAEIKRSTDGTIKIYEVRKKNLK